MQTIYIDISNKGVIPTIYTKQGDIGRKFLVVFTDAGQAYQIPTGALFSVWYDGDSGEGNYTDIGESSAFSVDGNRVAVEIISQMVGTPGSGVICLVMTKATGGQIGSWNIPYICEEVPGIGSEAATEYYTAFSRALEELQGITENLTPAAIGAAPAGYGLGETSSRSANNWADATNCFKRGTTGSPDGGWWHGIVCKEYGSITTNLAFKPNNGVWLSAMRGRTSNGSWCEWEYVNPPMLEGVEYRTTERHNGKPVYAKLVNGGLLANNASKFVTLAGESVDVISVSGYLTRTGENGYFPLPRYNTNGNISAFLYAAYYSANDSATIANIISKEDMTNYTVFLNVKYTKNNA